MQPPPLLLEDRPDPSLGDAIFPGQLAEIAPIKIPQDGGPAQRLLQRLPLGEIQELAAIVVDDLKESLHAHQLAQPADVFRDLFRCEMKSYLDLPFRPGSDIVFVGFQQVFRGPVEECVFWKLAPE